MTDTPVTDAILGDDEDPNASIRLAIAQANEAVVNALKQRQLSYRRLLAGSASPDDVKIVLEDLERFCRGNSTTYDENARTHALLTGRQEVWMRMQDCVRLDPDEYVRRYTQPHEVDR